MRLRLALAFTALVALAACDQAGQKAGSARAPIGGTPSATEPAKTAAATPAANCPTVAPACPTPAAAKAAKAAPKRHHVARTENRVRTVRTISTTRSYSHAQDGLPRRPYRYDELTRYSDEPAVRPYEDADYYAYDEGRASGYRHYERKDAGREHAPVRKEYRRHDSDGYAHHGYRAQEEQRRYDRRETYADDYRSEDEGRRREREDRYSYAPLPAPPAPPAPAPARGYDHYSAGGYDSADRYGQSGSRYYNRESAGRSGGVSYRSSTSADSNYVTRSSSSGGVVVDRGCCTNGQAAGFDGRGYLTWPGKTPR